jgi:hypothetical protein
VWNICSSDLTYTLGHILLPEEGMATTLLHQRERKSARQNHQDSQKNMTRVRSRDSVLPVTEVTAMMLIMVPTGKFCSFTAAKVLLWKPWAHSVESNLVMLVCRCLYLFNSCVYGQEAGNTWLLCLTKEDGRVPDKITEAGNKTWWG